MDKTMQKPIEAYPSSSPLQCTGRAREILLDLRRKREALIAQNPILDNGKMKTARNENRQKNFETESSSRAKDILVDMKSKRASLSSVLEACKTSSKRKNRSEGPSTAPTAASTRSCLSSYADDDSFSYSESSQDENPGFEIIIETEESDLCSLSTREEVENALGTIYQQVIPKALSSISNEEMRNKSIASCQYSLNVISENTAIDFPLEEKKRMRSKRKKKRRKRSNKKSESTKKKDETRIESSSRCYRPAESFKNSSFDITAEEELDSTEKRLRVDSKRYGLPSEATPSFESQQLLSKEENDLLSNDMEKKKKGSDRKKEIKKAKRHPNRTSPTVAECSSDEQQSLTATKGQSQQCDCQNERTNNSVSSPSIPSYHRRPRQDDSSFGSNKPSSQLLPTATSNSQLLDTDLQQSTSEPEQKKSRKSNGNIRTVSKPERKRVATRIEKGKRNQSFNSENVVVACGSESSLLNLQKTSTNNETFSSRSSQSQKCDFTLSPSFQKERYNPDTPELKSEESGVIVFQDEIDNSLSLPRLESKRRTWVRSRSKLELAPSIDAPAPRKLRSRSGIEKKSQSESRPTVQSNQNREDCSFAIAYKETYTMDDIMAEMNRLAIIQAKEGLKIPSETVLTLRSNKAKSSKLEDGDNFSTGWSFSEASDVSTLTSFSEDAPENPVKFKQSPVSDDISKKFCGGLYHIAVMSGMPATQQEI
mmetsp:Transcript_17578/g.26683  ORF Transcript_17578/g.26683 Transcript_17578/m.26683 type:complete len:710 (-) Transcript_17578:2153-4282(-)